MSFDPFGVSLFLLFQQSLSEMGKKPIPPSNHKVNERMTKQALNKFRDKQAWAVESRELVQFEKQLEKLGLLLKDVKGDGNCLFRALGDQLTGEGEKHMDLRGNTIKYIQEHRDDFEPFLEEGAGKFEDYVHLLAQNGTYAGNWALIGFARFYNVNITIHQLDQPPWKIMVSDHPKVRVLHVAYFGYEHYSSIRNIGGPHSGPANVEIRRTEEEETPSPPPAEPSSGRETKTAKEKRMERQKLKEKEVEKEKAKEKPHEKDPKGKGKAPHSNGTSESLLSWHERQIMETTGCTDLFLIRSLLEETRNDVDTVIGMLLTSEKSPDEEPSTLVGEETGEDFELAIQRSVQSQLEESQFPQEGEDGLGPFLQSRLSLGKENDSAVSAAKAGNNATGLKNEKEQETLTEEEKKGQSQSLMGNGKQKVASSRERKELAKKMKKENRARVLREQAVTAQQPTRPNQNTGQKEILI